jgi:hypothetical protein
MIRRSRRAAFTLMEMLVVIFFIIILATLVVAISPRISEQSRAARGADQLQGWLLIGKQRAKNGGRPAGLRLQVPVVTTAAAPMTATSTQATLTAMNGDQGNGILWSIVGDSNPGDNRGSNLLIADDEKGQNAEVVHVLAAAGNTITLPNTAPFKSNHPANAPVRLLGFATTLQYIEQPDDFAVTGWPDTSTYGIRRLAAFTWPWPTGDQGAAVLDAWPPGTMPTVQPDFQGGAANQDEWPVQPGDYLEVYGGGQVHLITSVNQYAIPNPPNAANSLPNPPFPDNNGPTSPTPPYPQQQYVGLLTLKTAPANSWVPGMQTQPQYTTQYRIIRAPRVLRGEQDLQMPASVAIDLSTNFLCGNQLPIDRLGNIDILFAPSGSVVGRAPTGPSIILWVRDVTKDQVTDGDPTVVTTYVRTGFIAAHPVDIQGYQNFLLGVPGATPYTFTLDGRSSGL